MAVGTGPSSFIFYDSVVCNSVVVAVVDWSARSSKSIASLFVSKERFGCLSSHFLEWCCRLSSLSGDLTGVVRMEAGFELASYIAKAARWQAQSTGKRRESVNQSIRSQIPTGDALLLSDRDSLRVGRRTKRRRVLDAIGKLVNRS